MLKTFDLRGRERPLTIHGPPGLNNLLALAMRAAGRVGFDLQLVELSPGDVVHREGYRIAPFPVAHRGQAFGYALFEDERPGVFHPEVAVQLGLTRDPTSGACSAARPSARLARAGAGPGAAGTEVGHLRRHDACETLRVAAHRADVLVHEATFAEEERDRAADTGHSTARQAAEAAAAAEVGMLALVHLTTRYTVSTIRDEARAVFQRTVVPRDFDTIEVPFRERGEPRLRRWEETDALETPSVEPVDASA